MVEVHLFFSSCHNHFLQKISIFTAQKPNINKKDKIW